MAEEKNRLRREFTALRAALKSPERDGAICRSFLAEFSAERYFVYRSFRTEADTAELIAALLAQNKRVLVPRVAGADMLAVPYSARTRPSRFGTEEPTEGEDEPCELAVAPLLAVDCEGYRLGYGGGYYDRYFAAHPNVLRVGICYAGQVVPRLPRSKQDIPLHAIVTEAGVVHVRRK